LILIDVLAHMYNSETPSRYTRTELVCHVSPGTTIPGMFAKELTVLQNSPTCLQITHTWKMHAYMHELCSHAPFVCIFAEKVALISLEQLRFLATLKLQDCNVDGSYKHRKK